MNLVLRYVVVLAVLAIGDAAWLSYFAPAVFRPTLGGILLDDPRWSAAILFYLLYALAVLIFPLPAGLRARSLMVALACGALFGFFAYMTYDLTNFATIKAWTTRLAAMDVAWGTALTALATGAGYLVASRAYRSSVFDLEMAQEECLGEPCQLHGRPAFFASRKQASGDFPCYRHLFSPDPALFISLLPTGPKRRFRSAKIGLFCLSARASVSDFAIFPVFFAVIGIRRCRDRFACTCLLHQSFQGLRPDAARSLRLRYEVRLEPNHRTEHSARRSFPWRRPGR